MVLKGHLAAWCRRGVGVGGTSKTRQPRLKVIRLIQRERVDQGSSGGSGKQKETGNTLKVESTRLVDGLDLGGGRREVKDDSQVYGLSY